MKWIRKQLVFNLTLLIILVGIGGCAVTDTNSEKIKDVEYTVVSVGELPAEVENLIESNEKSKMQLSYTDQGVTYVIRGYGAQSSSGYSIEILEVYETETTICVATNLLGPEKDEEIITVETYPYIVIQIEESEKPIMFEGAN